LYPVFCLQFRRITDSQDQANGLLASETALPIQFVMVDEVIWQQDVEAAEAVLSTNDDQALLTQLVPPHIESTLFRL
jgi:hypothetical protein